MKRAQVPRVGPTGEKRTFHSLRHSYAKVALENGRRITWLSRHLGHSSLKVTTDIYGHFERAERKAEAERMAGAFGVSRASTAGSTGLSPEGTVRDVGLPS
jgi:integrase